MSNKLSDACVLECNELGQRAEVLSRGSRAERQEASVLLSRIANLRDAGLSTLEIEQRYATAKSDQLARELGRRGVTVTTADERRYASAFARYLRTHPKRGDQLAAETELRTAYDMLGRPISQTVTGPSGYFVPVEMSAKFFKGLAQVDPLLDPAVVNFEREEGYTFHGKTFAGWDLSTYAAVRVNSLTSPVSANDGQAIQVAAQVVPASDVTFSSGYIYKTTLAASIELFQDAGEGELLAKIAQAFSIGFARAIGKDLVLGTGSDQPSGLLLGAVDSGLTVGTGNEQVGNQGVSASGAANVTAMDLTRLYFALNRIRRASPLCAWVMADETYQAIRLATDNAGRPLIHVSEDGEMLFGKRVLIAPSVPYAHGSPVVGGKIVFGDLSAFLVRATDLSVSVTAQSGAGVGSVERGEYSIIGRMRADSAVIDPTNGAVPPIVFATIS
jgi:HK97 family phage major capsid protein